MRFNHHYTTHPEDNPGLCMYCGAPCSTFDYIPAKAVLERPEVVAILGNIPRYKVQACGPCKGRIYYKQIVLNTVEDRIKYLNNRRGGKNRVSDARMIHEITKHNLKPWQALSTNDQGISTIIELPESELHESVRIEKRKFEDAKQDSIDRLHREMQDKDDAAANVDQPLDDETPVSLTADPSGKDTMWED